MKLRQILKTSYPAYFYAILLYEGLCITTENLELLSFFNDEAFLKVCHGDSYMNVKVLQQTVYARVKASKEAFQHQPQHVLETPESCFILMALVGGVPHILQNPSLKMEVPFKLSALGRFLKSFRYGEHIFKWQLKLSRKALLACEAAALTIQNQAVRFEKNMLWGKASHVKTVLVEGHTLAIFKSP